MLCGLDLKKGIAEKTLFFPFLKIGFHETLPICYHHLIQISHSESEQHL